MDKVLKAKINLRAGGQRKAFFDSDCIRHNAQEYAPDIIAAKMTECGQRSIAFCSPGLCVVVVGGLQQRELEALLQPRAIMHAYASAAKTGSLAH
jgi:hypothetical protein